jgi:tRNA A37 threonylcarbamoyltransferase TsaD
MEYYSKKYKISYITIGGGVSANSQLRNILQEHKNWNVVLPDMKYTGDNAGMIAFYALLLSNDKRRNRKTKI